MNDDNILIENDPEQINSVQENPVEDQNTLIETETDVETDVETDAEVDVDTVVDTEAVADAEAVADVESESVTLSSPQVTDPATPTEDTQNEDAVADKDTPTSSIEEKTIPYHERYYLRYGNSDRTVEMDIAGAKSFLQFAGFDGGELRQARLGKDISENLKTNEDSSNQMRCSYCGNEVSGVDFYRLPDGRLRCTTCSNSVVTSKEEIEKICHRVIDNLDNFFGANIDVPVSIEVLEERKLKKKAGVPLGTQDEQSILILGVAINKKKKYSILLENGAPRISLIATFAHELTHIWQYTHWDNKKGFKKCSKKRRLLIYEGMAKWVEIQYLYLIGENAIAKREENITKNRQDEYGIGFNLYEDAYPLSRETMMSEETPFTTDKYPIE